MFNITPVTNLGKTYNRIEISPVTVIPNVSASWKSTVYTTDGAPESAIVTDHFISGPEYDAWGSDDAVIVNKTCADLGITLLAN